MLVVRTVAEKDIDALVDLAGLAGAGLTTLPKDRGLLAKRVGKSIQSLAHFADRPGGESYLFVMEDLANGGANGGGRVVGACGVVSKVGGFQPFYAYRIEKSLFESKQIGVRKEVPILTLVEDHDGPCEVGSLFLHPDYRHDGNGRLLQLVRFLFMAEHAEMFENTVVSEIRGVSSEEGQSPFWDAIGKHFFDIDFRKADYLSVVNKKFIADLMPDHPIYIPLLPYSAQAVIGVPHEQSRGAVKNLEQEGFAFSGMVDIFDAGPVMTCQRDVIRSVCQSRKRPIAEIVAGPIESQAFMMGTIGRDFRACKGPIDESDAGGVRIDQACAEALHVRKGDELRYVELRAGVSRAPGPVA
jgi:arginine N-succinyltransferase